MSLHFKVQDNDAGARKLSFLSAIFKLMSTFGTGWSLIEKLLFKVKKEVD